MTGTELEKIPSVMTTWGKWKALHPNTTAYVKPSIPYRPRFKRESFAYAAKINEGPVEPNDLIVGIEGHQEARAYLIRRLTKQRLVHDSLESTPILVYLTPDSSTAKIYRRDVDGRELHFQLGPEDRLRDSETVSAWDPLTGEALGGKMAGRILQPLVYTYSLWFAWQKYRPDTVVHEEERVWSFDKVAVGAISEGWQVAETGGRGTPARWEVVADTSSPSAPNAIVIKEVKNRGQTYNLLIAKDTHYKDVEMELMVKAGTGEEDQGGGPIWRARDADNYYIARWNPLEDNFRVYFVKNGRRKQLGSANVKADPKVWHEIKIKHVGNRIEAEFDRKTLIELDDSTFSEAGMVGLWTKADAATAFDDLEVEEAKDEEKGEDDRD